MNAGVQNIVVSLVVMQVARKIDFEREDVLMYTRIGYITAQVIILAAYYYVSLQIKKKDEKGVIKYTEPANPMSSDPPTLVTTTVKEYDLAETSKLLRSAYMGLAMMAFMHGYLKYTQPLFMQSIMGLKSLYEAKPIAIHLFGKPATGDLARPFKVAPSMFAPAAPADEPAAAAAVEAKKDK